MPRERAGNLDTTDAAPLVGVAETTSAPGGQRIAGRYEILGLVGAGGMGTVYRVRDVELDEIVALKALRPGWIGAPGALERFKREVKLARRVTHRNVARTFDIGESGDDKFLTMEYIDGPSLGRVIQERGALPVDEALRITAAITEALAAAHAAGVIHRDLKPDNVLLARDGRVVVTDFGIACAGASDAFVTAAGGVVGTPAYMSPEQVEGASIDPRSDLYALGLVLHEVLIGRPPFTGDSLLAIAAARLHQPPPDPCALRPELPPALGELTRRLLARHAKDRPPDAVHVLAELAAIDPAGPRVPQPVPTPWTGARLDARSVAICPLRSPGPAEDAWIGEGFTEDLHDELCLIRGLRVKARMVPREGDDPRAHGRRIGVDLVVEGSVRRHGDGVRVQLRMTSVHDGFHVWAARHDCALGDLLVLGARVAQELALAAGSVGPGTAAGSPAPRAGIDPAAIELYLRARAEGRAFGVVNPAVDLLDRALALAPNEPRILAARAMLDARDTFRPGAGSDEMLARARLSAERAIELGPDLAEPWIALAHVRSAGNDSPGAMRALKRAIRNGPSVVEAHEMAGRLLGEAGRVEASARLIDHALWVDPRLVFARLERARAAALRGDFDVTTRELAPLRSLGPIQYMLVAPRLSVWAGRVIHEPLEPEPELAPFAHSFSINERIVAETGALPEAGRRTLQAIIAQTPPVSRPRRLFEQVLAEMFGRIGDREAALAAVQRSVDAGLEDLAWIDHCPPLAPIRDDPRCVALREVLRARAEALARAWDDP